MFNIRKAYKSLAGGELFTSQIDVSFLCVCPLFDDKLYHKGSFTQAIFVAATRCNFCRNKIALGFKHVRNPCDIAVTNRTWFTPAILKLQL